MDENKLIPTFRDSLFNPTIEDSIFDLADIGLDMIFDSGVLQEIPFVKILVGVGKFAYSIRDRNFIKQTFHFIAHINDGTITSKQFSEYKATLSANPQKAEKELGRVLVLLDRIIDDEKEKLLAAFFSAYIRDMIDWEEFCELSEALDRLFITDVHLLYRIADDRIKTLYEEGGYSADRLVSVGLVRNPTSNIQISVIGGFPPFGKIPLSLTKLGKTFIQFNCSEYK